MWEELKQKGIKLPHITHQEINDQLKPVLRRMENVGIKLDVELLSEMSKRATSESAEIEKQIFKLVDQEFNINSPSQLSEILFQKLKLPTLDLKKNRKTGSISTAAGELRKLFDKHPIIQLILRYRELSKLLSTYLKPLPLLVDKDSRLHTTYGQDTTTGRLTSSEPNLQNIPIKGELGGEIRKAFIAEEGMKLIAADYSQIELRIVARLADDTTMLEAFANNIDIHANTAAEIFNIGLDKVTKDQRRIAKSVNFGVLYGMSPYGLSQALGIEQEVASQYIKRYFETHPGIRKYCDNTIRFAYDNGYVETLFGMRRHLPNLKSHQYLLRDAEERMAINTPVQGTAAEVLMIAMITLDKALESLSSQSGHQARMLLTVHDELVVEADDAIATQVAKLVNKTMEEAIDFHIPLICEVEIGKNWGEMEVVSFNS